MAISPNLISFLSIFIIFIFILQPCNSLSIDLQNNSTLYCEANHTQEAISLTQEHTLLQPSSSNGVGRALYKHPIRFFDPSSNTTASFSSRFSFSITKTPLSPSADGLTFLITSNVVSISNSSGYLGLPDDIIDPQGSFVAVEFDTNFDPNLGDINDNHVGIDLGTVVSFVSVGLDSLGINLKNGRQVTAWIEYEDGQKKVMVSFWVTSGQFKPLDPILSAHVDLPKKVLKEFMLIGFSASNGRFGSAHIVVDNWHFQTVGLLTSGIPKFEDEDGGGSGDHPGCLMCSERSRREPFNVQDRFFDVCIWSGQLKPLDPIISTHVDLGPKEFLPTDSSVSDERFDSAPVDSRVVSLADEDDTLDASVHDAFARFFLRLLLRLSKKLLILLKDLVLVTVSAACSQRGLSLSSFLFPLFSLIHSMPLAAVSQPENEAIETRIIDFLIGAGADHPVWFILGSLIFGFFALLFWMVYVVGPKRIWRDIVAIWTARR